ncbi:carbamoyltransferase HypF [bacterium]|nr:carbamoyltransferase HypF [bacterium]NIN92060.1 carbamoyltransferase HypF [bacterium]NIO18273.1 carbamoyltransferase HypF [bacterium]NIO73247.1 carbamoyltransferase HypF [bacterium]
METRAKITVKGVVQGVGFRPFVHRLAEEFGLRGWVKNTTAGVVMEVEGDKRKVRKFYDEITLRKPAPAEIKEKRITYRPPHGSQSFSIKESTSRQRKEVLISPDIAFCQECLKELKDRSDRRHYYPFINCTNCGPRFTIIKDLPYDRTFTTMKKFRMCSICQNEYEDILWRRYHAEPNACPRCGPEIQLVRSKKAERKSLGYESIFKGLGALEATIKLLKKGKIVAIKGLGGFHLACDATNSVAVGSLRKRKGRPYKPFAIMVADIETAKKHCLVSRQAEELLSDWQKPIILLKKREGAKISDLVAPNNNYLGVMLPYTPLHYLLLRSFYPSPWALVMTSGNLSDQPIEISNQEAIDNLSHIADYFLIHNRDIYNRCDDSIVEIFSKGPILIRRARGYVPSPLELDSKVASILACGAELKNTFCLTKENYAFVSQYIGDLKDHKTLQSYERMLQRFEKLFDITPEIVAHDLHPDYLSTQYALDIARRSPKVMRIAVQHHHAHIVSCLVENRVKQQVIGVAFDGIGYGADGNIWGGEFLVADCRDFLRIGQLKYLPLPGGDRAVDEPWRMAVSLLVDAFGNRFPRIDFTDRWKKKIPIILRMIDKRINSPLTSSVGRFFDAVSSLLGICDVNTYEGQAAMELESAAHQLPDSWGNLPTQKYRYEIQEEKGRFIVYPAGIIRGIVDDLQKSVPKSVIAAKFHNSIADIIKDVSSKIEEKTGINRVAFSGGVFQNRLLLGLALKKLTERGFICYYQKQIPPNDGGVSLGQAIIANEIVKNKIER